MTSPQQIAEFLDQRITWPRAPGPFDAEMPWDQGLGGYPLLPAPRPTVDELAQELLAIAEFRALQLGTWLGTTDGELVAGAVEMVTPSFYRQDVELLVAALQRAAQLQQPEGQQVAGRNALGAIGVVALVAAFIFAVESGSTA